MIRVRCKALLFDMDGVLIDSTPAVARVWGRWAVEHGFDPGQVIARAHGRPSLSTIQEFLPGSDGERENRKVERSEMADLAGVVALPGASRLLAELPPERWTIVTSSTRSLAEVRLKAAGLSIPERLITSSDVTNGKPHPEPYIKAASALGLPAAECVVVEDVPAGIVSGKAAGCRVIAFRTTVSQGELLSAGSDWTLNNCSDISLKSKNPDLVLELVTP
ncbi:MAG: HAD family hydrolase [Acidobacteriales bacterium]|nr:HAD family hydrolase [Terriglobales bacterium]